jgi:hypothetical protein
MDEILNSIYVKYNLNPDAWFVKPYKPYKLGITVEQILTQIIECRTIKEAMKTLGYEESAFRYNINNLFPNHNKPNKQTWHYWILNQTEFKWCCDCKDILHKSNFSFDKSQYDGLNNRCKYCEQIKYKNNVGQFKANTAKRRAAQLQRTPKWANLLNIEIFYNKCPEGYHVDHIVPLQGDTVSGLHVENNLQYLLAKDNLSKSNKFNDWELENIS